MRELRNTVYENILDILGTNLGSFVFVDIRLSGQIQDRNRTSDQISSGCSETGSGHSHLQRNDEQKVQGKIHYSLDDCKPHQNLHSAYNLKLVGSHGGNQSDRHGHHHSDGILPCKLVHLTGQMVGLD